MIPNPLVPPRTSVQGGSDARAEGSTLNPYGAPEMVGLCVLNLSASANASGYWQTDFTLLHSTSISEKCLYLLGSYLLRPYAALGWHFLTLLCASLNSWYQRALTRKGCGRNPYARKGQEEKLDFKCTQVN